MGELRESMGYVEVKGRILQVDTRDVTVQGEAKKVFSGVIADETGKIQFTAWSDFKLKDGEVVRISKGTVKGWRGIPQLSFDDRSEVTKVKEKFPSAEELRRGSLRMISEVASRGGAMDATVRGIILEVREGSGLIMRCPECKRALQKGVCKLHGRVDGVPDLRIKAILDDGTGAVSVIMNRELTEKLTGTTLDEAMQKAKEKMDFEAAKGMMDEVLALKVATVTGTIRSDPYGLSMIANEAELTSYDVKQEAEKLRVKLEAPE